MKVLIDGDIVAYRCAASCEAQGVVVEDEISTIARVDSLMQRIISNTGADSHMAFLTGKTNFRHKVYSQYKATRKDLRRPQHLPVAREHLISVWGAEVAVDMEADDLLGIHQTDNTIIASIDKDLLMVPGKHYNFVTEVHKSVSVVEGLRHFYYQLIMGDRVDNIPGYDGKMRQKPPQFLQPTVDELNSYTEEEDMDNLVRGMYTDEEQYEVNKKLLYILREMPPSGVEWWAVDKGTV